jgi:hypothetical protein
MSQSAEIAKLAAALSKAQAAIVGAARTAENPYFKSQYADLATVWDAARTPLTSNGLSLVQMPISDEQGRIGLHTTLLHESGEWIDGTFLMVPAKPNDPQVVGSLLTYFRRYALSSAVGIPQIDDDGEAAAKPTREPVKAAPEALPPVALPPLKKATDLTLTEAQQVRLKALMKEHGVTAKAVKALVEQTYPIKTAADIKQSGYDDLCAWVVTQGGAR